MLNNDIIFLHQNKNHIK